MPRDDEPADARHVAPQAGALFGRVPPVGITREWRQRFGARRQLGCYWRKRGVAAGEDRDSHEGDTRADSEGAERHVEPDWSAVTIMRPVQTDHCRNHATVGPLVSLRRASYSLHCGHRSMAWPDNRSRGDLPPIAAT